MIDVSVIFTVYSRANIELFRKALKSILDQTTPPRFIIIVCDGCSTNPFEDIAKNLLTLNAKCQLKLFSYDENKGPGFARHYGIQRCTTEYIAIMDSDDISLPDRLQLQYNFMEKNPDISVVGGYIKETQNKKTLFIREVPLHHHDILETIKTKSPINNVTAFMRRTDYLETGGYPSLRSSEDYCLWVKFISLEKKLANIQQCLVDVEFDDSALGRRSGITHFKNDLYTQNSLYKSKIINKYEYIGNYIKYLSFRLMPIPIKKLIYRFLLRK
ncbi:glycosyltransferase [Providencia rettgeri]|uniref:glycosyltransferase n=1 Tax=Providencia rettgeri TaxID=587 RepID=UPI003018797A